MTWKFAVINLWLMTLLLAIPAGQKNGSPVEAGPEVEVTLGEPVIVALSEPGEMRWGFHQYPALFRLPEGRIGLGYSHNADAVEAFGNASPTYTSEDKGRTWKRVCNHIAGYKPHVSVCEIAPGEFLCMASTVAFNLKAAGLNLSPPAGFLGDEKGLSLHRYEDSPQALKDYVRELSAYRWTPQTQAWRPEKIRYDTRGLLLWKYTEGHLVPRTWFEHAPAKLDEELIYADYRATYTIANGKIPLHWPATCMVSRDQGRTWEKRGTIAVDPTGESYMTEPVIEVTSDGRLACAIRGSAGYTAYTQGHRLVITFSADRGHTWEPVKPLHSFGVFPGLLLLENKILVCSFGRPGVYMKFSADGRGTAWSIPTTLLAGRKNSEEPRKSCGYTSLLAVGPDEFLIAYSRFNHKDEQAQQRKAIVVRRVNVSCLK